MKKLTSKKKVLAATVAGLAVAGGGAAIAASQTDSPSLSFFDSVAKHLGISPEELEDATKAAAVDQVDQALEEGRITEEQADELKARIESGDFPGFFLPGHFGFREEVEPGGPGPEHHFFFAEKFAAVADYLGLTETELRERLGEGKSLAEIAEAEGKSVAGLKQAILEGARSALDEAVAAERLPREVADSIYRRLEASIDDLVNGTLPGPRFRPGFGPGFGFGFGGPPGFAPDGGGRGELDWDTAA